MLEFDYRYQFTKQPEVVDADALSADDVKRLAAACTEAGVRLIPDDQSAGPPVLGEAHGPAARHPEFDETPGKYPHNQGSTAAAIVRCIRRCTTWSST